MSSIEAQRARRGAWRKIHTTCVCGQEVYGNGLTHQRHCEPHLRERGWPVERAMQDAIRRELDGPAAAVIQHVEKRLGELYLARRAKGDRTQLSWREYKDALWRFVEAATTPPHPL